MARKQTARIVGEHVTDARLVDERGPPIERIKKTRHFDIGDTGVVTVRGSPLERCQARGVITNGQYQAGAKFRLHWYYAGLSEAVSSIDPNRIFATDGNFSGMAKTENQVFHRQRYRDAIGKLGEERGRVLEWMVCREYQLEKIGYSLGWENKSQAIAAATQTSRSGLNVLCELWGIDRWA